MYTITLNDGSKIEGLTFERNIFWSGAELRTDMFRGKLNPVNISSDEQDYYGITGEHPHMEVCYVKIIDGKYALALRDCTMKCVRGKSTGGKRNERRQTGETQTQQRNA